MGRRKRLPQMAGGSAPALSLSRPAQALRVLRPAGWVEPSSTDDSRLRGALPDADLSVLTFVN